MCLSDNETQMIHKSSIHTVHIVLAHIRFSPNIGLLIHPFIHLTGSVWLLSIPFSLHNKLFHSPPIDPGYGGAMTRTFKTTLKCELFCFSVQKAS